MDAKEYPGSVPVISNRFLSFTNHAAAAWFFSSGMKKAAAEFHASAAALISSGHLSLPFQYNCGTAFSEGQFVAFQREICLKVADGHEIVHLEIVADHLAVSHVKSAEIRMDHIVFEVFIQRDPVAVELNASLNAVHLRCFQKVGQIFFVGGV